MHPTSPNPLKLEQYFATASLHATKSYSAALQASTWHGLSERVRSNGQYACVGAADGAGEGAADGAALGTAEGAADGDALGALVGSAVGDPAVVHPTSSQPLCEQYSATACSQSFSLYHSALQASAWHGLSERPRSNGQYACVGAADGAGEGEKDGEAVR